MRLGESAAVFDRLPKLQLYGMGRKSGAGSLRPNPIRFTKS